MSASLRVGTRRSLVVALSFVLVFSLTACGDDDETPVVEPTTSQEDTSSEAADDAEQSEPDTQVSELPEGLADGFPDIGLPFYEPATLMAQPQVGPEMWIAEFDTAHELSIVLMFFSDRLNADNGWQDVNKQVNGDVTEFFVSNDEWDVTVAVRPELMDDSITTFIYTLQAK